MYGKGIMGCRKIARVFEILLQGSGRKTPHHTTIQQWIWRFGYNDINSSLLKADDWVAIADLTVSLGKKKLLAIIGVQMSKIENRENRALTHEDITVLGLYPCEKSNGQFVYNSLKDAANRVGGYFRGVVIDQGPDVKKGALMFQKEQQEGMIILFDIGHKLSKLLERTLKHEKRWIAYSKALGNCRNRSQQTEFMALVPPKQRRDARFMDLSSVVYWPQKIKNLRKAGNLKSISDGRFQSYLGWIKKFEDDLNEWEIMVGTTEMIKQIVVEHGLSKDLYEYLKAFFDAAVIECKEETQRFIKSALNIVLEEVEKLKIGEVIICSSDVLESGFGKYKAIKVGGVQGVTGNVLGLCSFVGAEKTEKKVLEAMENCSVKSTLNWVKEKVGITVGGLRRMFLKNERTKFDNFQTATFSV